MGTPILGKHTKNAKNYNMSWFLFGSKNTTRPTPSASVPAPMPQKPTESEINTLENLNTRHSELNFAEDQQVGNENLFKEANPELYKHEPTPQQPSRVGRSLKGFFSKKSGEELNQMHSELNFAEDQQVGNEQLFKETNPELYKNEPETNYKPNFKLSKICGRINQWGNAEQFNKMHSEINFAEDWQLGNEEMFKEANPKLFAGTAQ